MNARLGMVLRGKGPEPDAALRCAVVMTSLPSNALQHRKVQLLPAASEA
ncbi:MAG: hypothetical protein JNM79_06065 [Burkholderiales bacterium]|nr:hypothetical protein [Burkholderiales bacterium]